MAEKKNEWESEAFQQTFQLRVPLSFFKMIDDWRRKQEDLPGRSEAVRRLVEAGIKAERRPRK